MIDYDATLKDFFDEVIKFLEKREKAAKDKVEQRRVFDAIWAVNTVARNPKKYSDYDARCKDGLENCVAGFVVGGQSPVYRLYSQVLYNMENLSSEYDWEREQAQKVLLDAVRQIKYINDTNPFKSLYYPFLPLQYFSRKVKQK